MLEREREREKPEKKKKKKGQRDRKIRKNTRRGRGARNIVQWIFCSIILLIVSS